MTADETNITVIEYQHFPDATPGVPRRNYPGARRFALANGQAVRLIDAATFEVIADGEILRRIE